MMHSSILSFRANFPLRHCPTQIFERYVHKHRNENANASYIDQWHAATVKPTSFYEEHAAPGRKQKNYFYSVDLQGRVFLEETLPKNIATSLKNNTFLDTLFRQIRKTSLRESAIVSPYENDYPFISPCGIELNFIRPADSAIVFHTLSKHENKLVFGGSLSQPFMPNKLALSKRTGRLYHELICAGKKRPTVLHCLENKMYGLIKSSLAVMISDHFLMTNGDEEEICMVYKDSDGEMYPIAWLPEDVEPGSWSLPPEDDFDLSSF